MFTPNLGGPFAVIAAIFATIVWAIGTLILIAIIVALIVLLVRFLWVGTKAARRYLELNGSPATRTRVVAPAAAPVATTTSTPVAKPVSKPRTPKPKA